MERRTISPRSCPATTKIVKTDLVHEHVNVNVDVDVLVNVDGFCHSKILSRRATIFSLVLRGHGVHTVSTPWDSVSSVTPWFVFLCATLILGILICDDSKAAVTRYPERLLRLLDGREPFATDASNERYELPLKPLRDTPRGFYGAGARVDLQTIGQKLLLLDTAARGLLLKNAAAPGGEVLSFPEWVRPGPGIQSGIFRILPKLSWKDLYLTSVIVELFQGSEFPWIDGILSTEVFDRWVVRLDLEKNTMILIPAQSYTAQPELEWPSRLDLNWWAVETEIGGRKARLLLDTGSNRTFLSNSWALQDSRSARASHLTRRSGRFLESGAWKISLNGEPPVSRSL